MRRFSLTLDFRLNLFKVHLGLRLRPWMWRWFPYGYIPTCMWMGPIELTFYAGRLAKWFHIFTAIDIEFKKVGYFARFIPTVWGHSVEFSTLKPNYKSCIVQVGPLQFLVYEWKPL